MHMTGLCCASSSLGDGNCACGGGGSASLSDARSWDLLVPASRGQGLRGVSPHPLPTPPSPGSLEPKGVCLLLYEANQGTEGWLGRWGGELAWSAGELAEPAWVKDEDNSPQGC